MQYRFNFEFIKDEMIMQGIKEKWSKEELEIKLKLKEIELKLRALNASQRMLNMVGNPDKMEELKQEVTRLENIRLGIGTYSFQYRYNLLHGNGDEASGSNNDNNTSSPTNNSI